MRHLPYFLPVSEARAPEAVAAPERPYVLFVGRLVALKGLDRVLEAFRTYDAVDLVVVGEGDERKRLERSASDLPHVRFLGRKHPSALPELYAGALALVVPSVGYEVFGIVVLEAFAQGTPAIVSDLGALPELIADSGGGLTFRTDRRARPGDRPAARRSAAPRRARQPRPRGVAGALVRGPAHRRRTCARSPTLGGPAS